MVGEIIAAGGFVGLVGIVVRAQQLKIDRLGESKVDKALFDERTGNMMETLKRIDRWVEKIAKSNGFE